MSSTNSKRRFALGLSLCFFLGLAVVLAVTFGLFSPEERTLWDSFLIEIRQQQRGFSALLGEGVKALGTGIGFDAILYLVWICFLYGIFHALGPGHGKAVIASYTLTTNTRIVPAVVLAMVSSFVQGLTAILIVGISYFVIESSVRSASLAVEDIMEPLSYGAVSLVGLVLIWRGLRSSSDLCCGHDHGDDHHHHDHHAHDHTSTAHSCCSHGEHKVPQEVEASTKTEGSVRLRDFIAIVLAIGIRPCTGALLVLILAFVLGHWAGGLAAVLAMSFGTGITVSLLAVGARGLRFPLMKILDELGLHVGVVGRYLSVIGGVIILLIGGMLLVEVLSSPKHPFA